MPSSSSSSTADNNTHLIRQVKELVSKSEKLMAEMKRLDVSFPLDRNGCIQPLIDSFTTCLKETSNQLEKEKKLIELRKEFSGVMIQLSNRSDLTREEKSQFLHQLSLTILHQPDPIPPLPAAKRQKVAKDNSDQNRPVTPGKKTASRTKDPVKVVTSDPDEDVATQILAPDRDDDWF